MATRHFTPALFTFLKDLDAHNEREWFHEHKDRYLNSVQEPAVGVRIPVSILMVVDLPAPLAPM